MQKNREQMQEEIVVNIDRVLSQIEIVRGLWPWATPADETILQQQEAHLRAVFGDIVVLLELLMLGEFQPKEVIKL